MSSIAAPHDTPDRPLSLTTRVARGVLTAGLSRVANGRLIVNDGRETFSFGADQGPEAAVHVDVHDARFYLRTALGGSLGAAESYLDGDWSCDNLTGLFRLLLRNPRAIGGIDLGFARGAAWVAKVGHWLRSNTRAGSRRNIEAHYDLGNEFFRLFLDETMMYSSGIFTTPRSTLHEASIEKNDRICRRLDLRPDDHLLEIGTGWGGFALHAAGEYGCRITTTTISRKQYELASRRIHDAGLSDRVTVLLGDYRDLEGTYDKLVSIEMIEAVGHRYLSTYFRACGRLLAPHGMMLVQGIVMNEQGYSRYLRSVDFIQKYIFPGGCLPSVGAMIEAVGSATDMRPVHIEDFAPHYARTLRAWSTAFEGALDTVRSRGFSERFIRMWRYYFAYCEAAFDERATGVVQMQLAKPDCRHDPISMLSEGEFDRQIDEIHAGSLP
jgi:cyclopropane-fatty-acyl-phospholipid synthase